MVRESGVIFEDGTLVVLDADRVLLTTTSSSGAGHVAAWLEEWRQCEWPTSRVVDAFPDLGLRITRDIAKKGFHSRAPEVQALPRA